MVAVTRLSPMSCARVCVCVCVCVYVYMNFGPKYTKVKIKMLQECHSVIVLRCSVVEQDEGRQSVRSIVTYPAECHMVGERLC